MVRLLGPRWPRSRCRLVALAAAVAIVGALAAVASTATLRAQQGPIRLFPEQLTPVAPTSPRPGSATPGATGPAPATTPPTATGTTTGPTMTRTTGPITADPSTMAPTATGGVRIEGLAAPGLDAIGLAGRSEGGFEADLWRGVEPGLVLTVLAELPVVIENPPLRALTRRLLATGAPLAGAAPGEALALRLERLVAMGDLDTAQRLLAQLPPASTDSSLARLAADNALLLGDDQTACARAGEVGPTTGAAHWAKITVYCRIAMGDPAGARLSLDLLRDGGTDEDPAFFELATMLIEGEDPHPPSTLDAPGPVHLALLRKAGLGLPEPPPASLSPAVLAAAARDPSLAGAARLQVAEQAFVLGAIDVEALRALYVEAAASGAGGVALEQAIATEWGPATRARVHQALAAEADPAVRAALLAASWNAARGSERFLVAAVDDRAWTELPIERELVRAAPAAARALLAVDRPALAARWLSLLQSEARGSAGAQNAVTELAPLFALAGVGGRDTVPVLGAEGIAAWEERVGDAAAVRERLFALLDGVGMAVPPGTWQALVAAPVIDQMRVPSGSLWRSLGRAAAARRLGESVLLALAMLDGRPETVHAEVLVAALEALDALGLDQDARRIAVATALAIGL